MKQYGLIGYPLSHSFSKRYFANKFEVEKIKDASYDLFPLEQITDLPKLVAMQTQLAGLNVTIPYKQAVLDYLDEIDEAAAAIGAVNTIKFQDGKAKGFNTDAFGFERSLVKFLGKPADELKNLYALVLGTGGAAKAITYVLRKLGIAYKTVSRTSEKGDLIYADLDAIMLAQHHLVINTTPLGTAPNYDNAPNLPYTAFSKQHYCYDLVYNPENTLFLKRAAEQGAKTINGLEMLYLQAEKAWAIWNRLEA